MQSMSGTTLFVIALLLPMIVFGGILTDLVYSCNPSGTITVTNPDSSRFSNVYARTQDGSQNCSTVPLHFSETIIISECSISVNISLWFYDTSLPTIITDDMDFYVIRCQQIPATGIYRMITDESWVTNYISTSLEPSVTPRILLNTELLDIESGIQRTTAIVGEPLLWEIDGPEGYIILPLNCTVLSGAGDESIVLVIDGCSQDTYLVEHFEYASATDTHILQAHLYAFRFANSEQILIECDMLGCHNASTNCDFTCPSKRRRRNSFDDRVRDLVERQSARRTAQQGARTQDFYGERPSESSDLVGQVFTKLRVFGLEDSSSYNGSPKSAVWTTSLLLAATVLLSVITSI